MTEKVNVLVYDDGSDTESGHRCLQSLRQHLFPHYAVATITGDAILKEPWSKTCALLVISGTDDRSLRRAIGVEGCLLINQFVRTGGAFLGINAGGCYGSKRCEVKGDREELYESGDSNLGFFPGVSRRPVFPDSNSQNDRTARAVILEIEESSHIVDSKEKFHLYYKGGGIFVDADNYMERGVKVLARFADDINIDCGEGKAAIIYCKVGDGASVLASPHLEFELTYISDGCKVFPNFHNTPLLDDKKRIRFLRNCLSQLHLTVSQVENAMPPLSPVYLSSAKPSDTEDLVNSWKEIFTCSEDSYISGEHDDFRFEEQSTDRLDNHRSHHISNKGHLGEGASRSQGIPKRIAKRIIVYNRRQPTSEESPLFNHEVFYSNLTQIPSLTPKTPRFGRYLMYGEVMESTNTILASLLRLLPTGFTALASLQIAGRGRGSNVWVSPAGCLLFSTCVRHAQNLCGQASPLFVQYIAAIAVVEAVKSYGDGYENFPVKIKWPNDIYVEVPQKVGQPSLAKVGGILVQCSGDGKEYFLVVGIGLNITNPAPTTSLKHVLNTLNVYRTGQNLPLLEPLSLERLFARILVTFEQLYTDFCKYGWAMSLEELYLRHWIHSNQIVTLETLPLAPHVRIIGITHDFAHLRVEELDKDGQTTNRMHELHPDGNSFDFFHGLLKKKG